MNEDTAEQEKSSLSDLEILKGRLEQQEAAKLKAEQIVSTLTRIKAREKASRRRLPARDEVTNNASLERKSHSASNSAIKEKSNLLKRKLEEDRARLESQKCSENLNKATEVVETIRARLEDRDKLMQQLFLDTQQLQESSLPDNSANSLTDATLLEPELPDEVKAKIADLEAKIIDLQENLKEKDNVISARTQAITLLSEDLSRKSKTTLDTLEETQQQMRQMQNNFISIEDKMKKEIQRLKEDAEDRKQRCILAEKNLRIVEAARFDLSTRAAELQEKVVALQTKNIELEKIINDSVMKQNELQESLEAAKSTNVKIKAKFKLKLKALEEERDTMKKMSKEDSEAPSLQERIAELEEEKGNLQLSLVDFDEQQEQCRILKETIADFEQKLSQKEDDLDFHVKAISKLEAEKLDLIQVVQEHGVLLSTKDSLISQLQQQLSDIEQLKVSAEMRAIELEEKLDVAMKDTLHLNTENTDLNCMKERLMVQEETIKELQSKLLSRQNEILQGGGDGIDVVNLNSELEEWKRKYFEVELRLKEVNNMYKESECRLERLERQHDEVIVECEQFKAAVTQLQNIVDQSSRQQEFNANDEHLIDEGLSSANRPSGESGSSELMRLREELASTTAELHKLSAAMDSMNSTSEKIDELDAQLTEKEKTIADVRNELDKRTRKLSEYKKFHKLKSEDVIRVSHELETVTATSQQKISQLEGLLLNAQETEAELRKELKENTTTVPSDQTQKMKKLAASLKLKVKACKELEEKMEQYKKTLEEKDEIIKQLRMKDTNVSCDFVNLGDVSNENLLSREGFCQQEETAHDMSNLETLVTERDCLKIKLAEQQQMIDQLEREMNCLQEERDNTISEMETLQKNAFAKNDELLKVFEAQVLLSKEEVNSLQEQLAVVESKYHQTWAKLQEKDAYIESKEAELSKALEKLQLIESSSDELKESLKKKAELLNDRLQQTEQANVQFENYKSELEFKLTLLSDNESALQKNLTDKINENEELKHVVGEFSSQIERFEREVHDSKNYIIRLQNEAAYFNDIQSSYSLSLGEVERLNNEIKELKSASEKSVACVKDREKMLLENAEIEMKSVNDRCTAYEQERNSVARELELLKSEHLLLKDQLDKQKSDFEMRYIFLESERNHFQELCLKFEQQVRLNEEEANKKSEINCKEVEDIIAEQSRLVNALHADFKTKECSYVDTINELKDYNVQLQEGLRSIESNAEALKTELHKVGTELTLCKEELVALKADQEKSLLLKNELERVKADYKRLLEDEQAHVKTLEVQLLRQKARTEVDSVVTEAVTKVDLILQEPKPQTPEYQQPEPRLFTFPDVNSPGDVLNLTGDDPLLLMHSQQEIANEQGESPEELKTKLIAAYTENERLAALINKYENNMSRQPLVGSRKVSSNLETGIALVECKDEEDGWGWTAEEMVEEQECGTGVGVAEERGVMLSYLEKRLEEAELKNSKLAEELKASQIRCSKLVKKAKELKAKSEDLERGSRERSVGFEDLDFAMQEELRTQIQALEVKLQESISENRNWKTEKENYLRKIDTLTSGNDRLIDMKERQDIELAIFEKQNSDLKQQILAFEWKVEELMEDHEKLTDNSSEMERKVNSLAKENEYLIQVVGEMKDNQKSLNLSAPQEHHSQNNPLFTGFRVEDNDDKVKVMYDAMLERCETLENENLKLVTANGALNDTVNEITVRINELEIENDQLKSQLEDYIGRSSHTERMLEENQILQNTVKSNETLVTDSLTKVLEMENRNKVLTESLAVSTNAELELNNRLIDLQKEKDLIEKIMEQKYQDLLHEFNIISNKVKETTNECETVASNIETEKDKEEEEEEEEEKKKEEVVDPPSCSALFATSQEPDQWYNNNLNVNELTEQVCTLTSLLEEKETELEMSKQMVDNITLGQENLQDVWSEKFEHLKTESTCTSDNELEKYKELLTAVESKFKDNLILKDEEIAHLTCRLSSKEQQLANLNKDISILQNSEVELKITIDRCKEEMELQRNEILQLHQNCDELKYKLDALHENEKEYAKNLSERDSALSNLKSEYETCLKAMKDEFKSDLELRKDDRYLEEREKTIEELEKMLEDAKFEISELRIPKHKPDTTEVQVSGESDAKHEVESRIFTTKADPSDGLSQEQIIFYYKKIIQQRDLEIEKLMEALGEAEEKVIKAEEMRLQNEHTSGLKLQLDRALYLLHLRDVRCEELTLELMQLLEERDTLQLRLSTALRLNEDLRRKTLPTVAPNEQVTSEYDPTTKSLLSSGVGETMQLTTDQNISHSDSESRVRLNEKLGELHSIGYKKDLSVHQDRLQRHNEQMHLYSTSNSPQSQSSLLNTTSEEHNTSGGLFSWIFGSGSSSNTQMDV